MNARNQLLTLVVALMLVCSSGAMVTAAAGAGTVEQSDEVEGDEVDQNQTDNETTDGPVGDDGDVENATADDDDGLENESVADDGEQQSAYVTFEDQATDGETVVVENVSMASGGFVTIHDSSLLVGDAFESVIGTSAYLEAGAHENVEVTLDEPLEEDETLIAMPHRDTNDNQEYDFVETEGQADGPFLTADDEPVTDDAVVSVDGTDEGSVADNETEDNETGDVVQEPVDEEPVDENKTDAVDEEPVDEQPIDGNETDGVDEGPVAEEPVDEEPAAADELTINVIVEQLNVHLVTQDELNDSQDDMFGEDEAADNGLDAEPSEDNETDGVEDEPVEGQPIEGGEDNETGLDEEPVDEQPVEDGPVDDNESATDAEAEFGDRDLSFENVAITVSVENLEIQGADGALGHLGMFGDESAAEEPTDDNETDDGLDVDTDTETADNDTAAGIGDETNETNETDDTDVAPVEDDVDGDDDRASDEAGDGHQIQITIEEATVFVVLEDGDEMPIEEEPVDEEPVEDEPVDEEPVDEAPIEDEEPTEDDETDIVEEEPAEDENVTDDVDEGPVDEEPIEDEEPAEDNETDAIEDEPADEEPTEDENVTDDVDEEIDGEVTAESFVVSEFDAPEEAAVGDPLIATATIENPTDEERTESVEFRLNGDFVTGEEVTLESGESANVEFQVNTSSFSPGSYIQMVLTEQSGQVATIELTEGEEIETDETNETDNGDDDLTNGDVESSIGHVAA